MLSDMSRKKRPRNTKIGRKVAHTIQMEYEDSYRRDGPSPATSKIKVAMSHNASDRCWPISRERKVPEIPELVSRLRTPRTIMRTSFKFKRSKVKVDYC